MRVRLIFPFDHRHIVPHLGISKAAEASTIRKKETYKDKIKNLK